jgi:5'-nucleotidase (lipoprotein e(P4) family)
MHRHSVTLAVLILATGCVTVRPTLQVQRPPATVQVAAPEGADPRLNAVVWMQTAAEYHAAAVQAFQMAQRMIDRALADPNWTAAEEQTGSFGSLPPAVIVDIDETVLDNSPFEARQIRAAEPFSEEIWRTWVLEANAEPTPGALTFTRDAAARGITIFYVSNRLAAQEDSTRANLARRSFPLDPTVDTVLSRNERPEWTSNKGLRRAEIASRYRILLLVGDDLGDFTSRASGSLEERLEAVTRNASLWGSKWIIVPNPAYGSWERAVVGTEPNLSEAEKLRRKINALRP